MCFLQVGGGQKVSFRTNKHKNFKELQSRARKININKAKRRIQWRNLSKSKNEEDMW
jgi:hypothetical protein